MNREQLNRMIKRLEDRAIKKFIDQFTFSAIISCLHEEEIKYYYELIAKLETREWD